MLTAEHLLYIIADRTFYESVARYTPNDKDFRDEVALGLSTTWQMERTGVWYYCFPANPLFRVSHQGWKIHVSSELTHAAELLRRVLPILKQREVSFKFAVDRQMLTLLNSKLWHRGGSGKFITIYPPEEVFQTLLQELDEVTADLNGPLILSDRRYHESKVIHYRYGGFKPINKLSIEGYRVPQIVDPAGKMINDERLPHFSPPEWAVDPFPLSQESSDEPEATLGDRRYRVEEALTFTNAGGVYVGADTHSHGRRVVIKEARPWVHVRDESHYATDLLKKEYRMLQQVADAGVAPEPIDYFTDWEHDFLVEEFISGESIAKRWATDNVLIRTRPSAKEYRSHRNRYRKTLSQLCSVLSILHSRGIIFGDLSPNNLIISEDGSSLRIIDFEGACFVGDIAPIRLYTPGFAPRAVERQMPCPADDLYALGALMAYLLFPYNMLYFLDDTSKERIIPILCREVGFTPDLADLILALMNSDAALRPTIDSVVQFLDSAQADHNGSRLVSPHYTDTEKPQDSALVPKLLSFVKAHLSCDRKDRIVPCDKEGFATNPLGIAYGAAGVAMTLQEMEGAIPSGLRDCLSADRLTDDREIPPGLYTGMSGIAWVLWECGMHDRALALMKRACNHGLALTNPNYLHGMAGQGIAALWLHSKSASDDLLSFALSAGEHLLKTVDYTSEEQIPWNYEGFDHGLGKGCSGTALFLLYLHCVTGDKRFLDLGEFALSVDLEAALRTDDGGLSWRRFNSGSNVVYPYWKQGSAGVGSVVARYLAVTKKDEYRRRMDGIFIDLDRRYTLFPGLFYGQSGIGHCLLDCYHLLGDTRYLTAAGHIAEGVMVHFLPRDGGIAIPGDGLFRLSCDYATGSCGVASFLARFSGGRRSTPLFPDDLLQVTSAPTIDDELLQRCA